MVEKLDLEHSVQGLLDKNAEVVNENANKDSRVFSTQRDLLAGVISKEYAMKKILPREVAEAHLNGDIHYHDADYSLQGYYNCMLIDVPRLLKDGFNLGNARIEEPKSLRVAGELIPQIIAHVSANIYGGCAIHAIDEVLEPYAEKSYQKYVQVAEKWVVEGKREEYIEENMRKEIYDTMQSLEYEISATSARGQAPFVTFNFGLTTGRWGREIQKAILNVRLHGMGPDHITPVFPKLVFTLKRGVNLEKEDPNYDIKQLALECASKRIYPDVISYDKIVELTGHFVSVMGCRSFLSEWRNEKGEQVILGRRNIGVCSINLPRIALESETIDEFYKGLDDRLAIVKQALYHRYNALENVQACNAPVLYEEGATGHKLRPTDTVQKIFNDGEATASIGYIGLHEVATKFFGEDWQDNPEAKKFTLDILRYLNKTKNEWNAEKNIGFSIYGTPAESLTDRFCRLDQKRFGDVPGITDKGWYTNSFHLTPTKKVDPFEKIDFEKEYIPLSTGGNICYIESANLSDNLDALETLWNYAYDRVMFFGVNTPISQCYECGYEGKFDADAKGFFCPQDGNRDPKKMEVIERMCGYLSSVAERKPIEGRVKEIKSRVKHVG